MKEISTSYLKEKFKDKVSRPIGKYNYSAVLVPIIEKEDGPHLLFEVRAEHLKRQPGEISFPGGKMEEGETPKQCAVRETCEELCISEDDIQVIGDLNYINSYNNFTLYSYLGIIKPGVVHNDSVSQDEVKEVFTVPLKFFLENEPYVYHYKLKPEIGDDFPYEQFKIDDSYDWRMGSSSVPIYTYEDWVIWGLTARLVQDFVNTIKELE